ncbi:MAG: SURF1 family cytochrome oxidase biogenesis protein [Nakamurella sp.]
MSSTREHPAAHTADRPPRRWAFLMKPGWIAAILAACAFAFACFFILAPWQFGRHAERSTQNTAVEASLNAPPVPVTDLLSTSAQPADDVLWRVVTATGQFDPSRQVQVRLRQDSNGQPVSEVIAPFRLDSGELLLVDRGYVSFADVQAGAPIAALPTGPVTISGRVQAEQVDPKNRQPLVVGDHVEAYAINVAAVSSPLTGSADPTGSHLKGYLQLTASSPAVLISIDLPQTDDGPFLSYALQWEAFGVIALIGMGVFIFREAFAPRPPDDRDGGPDGTDGVEQPAQLGTAPSGTAAFNSAALDRTPVPAGRERRRAARDGFDKSQLYD